MSPRRGQVCSALGLLVGICATLPVLAGPRLAVARNVEIVDHLVPGLVVLAASAIALLQIRSPPVSGMAMLGAGLVITLAGLWMVATHLPLLAQAGRHDAPWGGAIYHSISAVLVLALGVVWTKGWWAAA